MSILSRTTVSALSTALLTACFFLAGLSPVYGQNAAPPETSLTPAVPPGQSGSSTSSAVSKDSAGQKPEASAEARRPHARMARTTHRHAVRQHQVAKVARDHHYPMGPSGKVNVALRADRRLIGSRALPARSGGVVLQGRVFDEPERLEAERIAMHVRGVKYVVNDLQTSTGQWMAEQTKINSALVQVPAMQGVSAHVIGPEVFLSGQVNSESDKAKAVQMVADYSHLQVVNMIRVVPPSVFSLAWWTA